jgi:hypothetical protein
MKVSKYDFIIQEHYTGKIRVKLLMFQGDGVRTYEKIIEDKELIDRINTVSYPDYKDLLTLKRIVKGKQNESNIKI